MQGTVAGLNAPTTLTGKHEVPAPDLDNFFLVRMVDQWTRARAQPALLRADRALTLAYQQTKVEHIGLLAGAQLAIERNELDGAAKLFEEAKRMSPRDGEADAGLRIIAKLKDGTLTREAIRNQLKQARIGDKLTKVDGKVQVTKTNFVALAQIEEEPKKPAGAGPQIPGQLQQQQERALIEEQKMTAMVEDSLRQARRELAADPDGMLELLRNTLVRINDHPTISERVRDTLGARLQTALRETATQGRLIKQRQEEQNRNLATIREMQEREAQRRTHEERQIAQFKRFKEEISRARFEEKTKQELLAQMIAMETEARLKGQNPPLVAKVLYDQTQAMYNLEKHHQLRRLREERFLATLLAVEKSHVPYPDEPGIFYPPVATWKAISETRKEKYEVSSLPDDDKARKEANELSRMLEEVINMEKLDQPMTMKEALGLFYEMFINQGQGFADPRRHGCLQGSRCRRPGLL